MAVSDSLRSLLDYECLLFHCVTDLVLIYESVAYESLWMNECSKLN
jgi:hypothetical protein